ncbi:hypothetical protein CFAM422_002867 [Trichoderma lentiforme]|uniref:Secreted protein n=1 Tax=Trichoderma lentiforme TaxID=1567552 RepID=A0A9P5CEZ6_9HYPO|nr:hypothetical protein CFAM422_002867 [Trichoderma lentiforme]
MTFLWWWCQSLRPSPSSASGVVSLRPNQAAILRPARETKTGTQLYARCPAARSRLQGNGVAAARGDDRVGLEADHEPAALDKRVSRAIYGSR